MARQGAHRGGRGGGRAGVILAVILALAVVGVGAWFLLFREGAPIDIGIGRSVPDFSFQLVRVNGTAISPGNEGDLEEPAEEVRETMDALYVAGFIDPGKWEDGTFPEVLDQFDRRAAEQASADLPFLSLGGEAGHVEFVEPVVGKMDVRFLVDPDANPAGAVATTRFVADGEFADGRPMFVLHNGTYYLRRAGGRWVITGYDVNGVVQPGRRPTGAPTSAPTSAPSPGATP